jgi:hypothetical protein
MTDKQIAVAHTHDAISITQAGLPMENRKAA